MNNEIAIIGGCGHVGLPLGIALASRGNCRVTLVDINAKMVDEVNSGHMHFVENGGESALRSVIGRTLHATTQAPSVTEADVIVIVTGTPVDEHLNPKVQDVIKVVDQYLPYFKNGQLLVLRSTLFPGTTEVISHYLSTRKPGVDIAFCPERVAQGCALEEIYNFPQMISGTSKRAEDRAAELFLKIAPEVLRLTPKEAELTKLYANSWRYLQFAIANQFYVIAESSGVNFQRVYQALTHNYPRMKNCARPGLAAGPCLFKDTIQLSAFHNNNFFLGHAAMLINEGLPNFLIEQLEKKIGSVSGKKIGILGMAFKADSDDTRDSLSYKLKKLLSVRGAEVWDTDVYQQTHSKLQWILKAADGIILGVPHREYLDLRMEKIPYVDCWGVWDKRADLSESPFAETLTEAGPRRKYVVANP